MLPDKRISVNVPSWCSANMKAPDLKWTELEVLRSSLPVSCCQCNYSYFEFILPVLFLHGLWRKRQAWKKRILECKKRVSCCKLEIHSKQNHRHSFRLLSGEREGRRGEESPCVTPIHDKHLISSHLIIYREHLETIFSTNFTNFLIMVWVFPSSTNQSWIQKYYSVRHSCVTK